MQYSVAMTLDMPKESIVFLGGILLSSILIPTFLPIFRRWGVVDRPNARSTHTTATPRGMGVVVVLTFVVSIFAYVALAPSIPLADQGRLEALLWSVLLLVVVGFLDDTKGVSAPVKLVFQCGSAVILIATGFVMPLPALFGEQQALVEQGFTLLWIVGVINAVNFIDGSDGLATTLSTLSMLLFVGISRILPSEAAKAATPVIRSINLLGLAGAGCALPFLLYNLSPAKCFLGDSGSTFFGLVLAILGVLTAQYNSPSGPGAPAVEFSYSFFLVPWLILCVPIADAIRVAVGRVLRGRSPLRPDNRHLHHVLHRAGLSPNQMLLLISIAVLIFGLTAAILVRSSQSPFILMGIVVLLLYGLFWFLKSSYRARRFVTLALNRRLLHFMEVTEGYENPASFKERFEQELARAKRHGGALSVVVINAMARKPGGSGACPLENPKFLENLLRSLRREDVKCRFSTDRLAFLLVETDKELASRVCERIWQRFDSIKQGESADLHVGIGVSAFPLDGVSVTNLLQGAEAAALASKGVARAPRVAAPASVAFKPPVAPAIVLPGAVTEPIASAASVSATALPQEARDLHAPPRPRWEAPLAEKEALVSRAVGGNGKRWFGK